MNMYNWLNSLKGQYGKKSFPIVSYPGIQLMSEKSIQKIVKDQALYAECVIKAANYMKSAAACTLMDLSVEAECFGAEVKLSDTQVPAVKGTIINSPEEIEKLIVPSVNTARAKTVISAVKLIKKELTDKPLFAGVIGPFSLAGRLASIEEVMYYCFDCPHELSILLTKCTEFIINYIKELIKAGADGVLLCEPLSGMLSPQLEREFSQSYVKSIVDAVQNEDFIVIYHNCGNGVINMLQSFADNGSAAYHFGNAVSLKEVLSKMPTDRAVLGNINPVETVHNGTEEDVIKAVNTLCEQCSGYDNFVLSTGCDVPADTSWKNINALFIKS